MTQTIQWNTINYWHDCIVLKKIFSSEFEFVSYNPYAFNDITALLQNGIVRTSLERGSLSSPVSRMVRLTYVLHILFLFFIHYIDAVTTRQYKIVPALFQQNNLFGFIKRKSDGCNQRHTSAGE